MQMKENSLLNSSCCGKLGLVLTECLKQHEIETLGLVMEVVSWLLSAAIEKQHAS